jgi:VanZ family protein
MLMYLVLTLVLLWDSKRTGCQPWLLWTIAIAIPVIYGGFIEMIQERCCYPRTGDWMDWLADCVGVALAVGGWIIGTKWYERRVAQ